MKTLTFIQKIYVLIFIFMLLIFNIISDSYKASITFNFYIIITQLPFVWYHFQYYTKNKILIISFNIISIILTIPILLFFLGDFNFIFDSGFYSTIDYIVITIFIICLTSILLKNKLNFLNFIPTLIGILLLVFPLYMFL